MDVIGQYDLRIHGERQALPHLLNHVAQNIHRLVVRKHMPSLLRHHSEEE
jgi:hypothetical protein